MQLCQYCGKEIIRKTCHSKPLSQRKYCSRECSDLARGVKTYGIATCAYCGKEFKETRDRPNTYCSKACNARARSDEATLKKLKNSGHHQMLKIKYDQAIAELKLITWHMNHDKYCEECGGFFVADNSRIMYCSDKCKNKAINRRKEKRIYKNGTPDLTITLQKLFVRDAGTCQICGRELSFKGDPNGKYYPSIDHIIPLACGGKHEWVNVQLACRKCNTIKGANV